MFIGPGSDDSRFIDKLYRRARSDFRHEDIWTLHEQIRLVSDLGPDARRVPANQFSSTWLPLAQREETSTGSITRKVWSYYQRGSL